MGRSLPLSIALVVLLASVSGCSQSSAPEAYNGTREWGPCAIIGGVAGAAIGWGLGLGLTELTSSSKKVTAQQCQTGGIIPVGQITCSLVGIPGQTVPIKFQSKSTTKQEEWIGPAAAIPGAIIGAIVGHYACDPIFESPYHPASGYALPPPPPPPAPTGMETPSTPPSTSSSQTTPSAQTSANASGVSDRLARK